MGGNSAIDRVLEAIFAEKGLVEHWINNKAIDFPIKSVVKCTYLKGLFRVIGYTNYNGVEIVVMSSIDHPEEDNRFVSPKFLEKTTIDESTLEVLYNVRT